MNRFKQHSGFDDNLGQMLRHSLQSEAARRDPPPGAWAQIQERIRSEAKLPGGRRSTLRVVWTSGKQTAGLAPTVFGGLFGLCTSLVSYLVYGRTIPPESLRAAEVGTFRLSAVAQRYQLSLLTVNAWPLMG